MSKAHSELGASSAHRWFACAGSVRLCKQAPKQRTSKYAAEGTAAHMLAEKCLTDDVPAKDMLGETFNGFAVTSEMAEAVQVYLDEVNRICDTLDSSTIQIERKFDLSSLHEGMFGTNDACISQPFGKLYVLDYKHGAGVAVDAEDNEQLLYYAVGAARSYNYEFTEVEMIIVQPRAAHKEGVIRRDVISLAQLREWERLLVEAAKRTEAPDASFHAGDHCRWCPAKLICDAFTGEIESTALMTFEDSTVVVPEPKNLSEAQLKKLLDFMPQMKAYFDDVFAYAESRAINGEGMPEGWKLVNKKSNRAWVDEDEAEKALTKLIGRKKCFTEPKLLSPTQLEKVIKEEALGADVALKMNEYVHKPYTGVTLVSNKDKRQAVEPPRDALQIFEEYTDA